MRKIDLSDYEVDVGGKPTPYLMKKSIEFAMFNPELRLNWVDLLLHYEIVKKIKNAEGSILLEESEYSRIKLAVENIHGFTADDVEFVNRIMHAPEVEVVEK